MCQSFRKGKEDSSRNTKTLLCLKHVGLMVVAELKSDAWVQTLIPLMSLAGQVPSPWASASPSGKGRGGSSSAEVFKLMRDITVVWSVCQPRPGGLRQGRTAILMQVQGIPRLEDSTVAKARLLNICANGMDRMHSGLGWGRGGFPSTRTSLSPPILFLEHWFSTGASLPPSWRNLTMSGDRGAAGIYRWRSGMLHRTTPQHRIIQPQISTVAAHWPPMPQILHL